MDNCYTSVTQETITKVGGGPCVAQHSKRAGTKAARSNPQSAVIPGERAATHMRVRPRQERAVSGAAHTSETAPAQMALRFAKHESMQEQQPGWQKR